MARTPRSYKEPSGDVADFIQRLAQTAGRHDTILSNPLEKARAFSFRRSIYNWRRQVLSLLAQHTEESTECLTWLHSFAGKRITARWLELTRFNAISDVAGHWFVEGVVQMPCSGPDIRFEDSKEFQDDFSSALALIKASRSQPASAD